MLTIIIFLVLAWLMVKIIFSGSAKALPKAKTTPAFEPEPTQATRTEPEDVYYFTPTGKVWDVYEDAAAQPHLLIAGTTGSGKSAVENAIINTLLYRNPFDSVGDAQFILIDPKGNELYRYVHLPHTLRYASEPDEMVSALKYAVDLMEKRQIEMRQFEDEDYYPGSDVYVFIDEFADLMTTRKRDVQPLVQRLAQRGRSARVHVVLCTQSPIGDIIPTRIKCNFDARIGLRTRSAQDSRNILGFSELETYPVYGEGYYMKPKLSEDDEIKEGRRTLPYVTKAEIKQNIDWWYDQMRQNGIDPAAA